jgi:hypothetical protein
MVSLPNRGNKLPQKEWSFDRERSFPAHMCSNSGSIPLLSQVRGAPRECHSMPVNKRYIVLREHPSISAVSVMLLVVSASTCLIRSTISFSWAPAYRQEAA